MSQATTCLGFEVQAYNAKTGWVTLSGPFLDPEEAHTEMLKLGLLGSGSFRVHPSHNKD